MHLGFITSEYPHPEVKFAAGIATSLKNLAIALVKQGVQVTVFVYHQKKDKILNDQGVTIHLIKSKKYTLLGWYYYRKQLQKYVNTIIKKEQIDIIEAPDWTGITAFMKIEAPVVIRFHGSDAYFCKLEGRQQKFKNYLFEKNALKNATAYIAPTAYTGEITAEIFKLDKTKVKVIHHGLELAHFVNEAPEVLDEHTLLYIGTIIRKKGVFELVEIFNRVHDKNPQAKLVVIGSDSPDIKSGKQSTFEAMKAKFSNSALKNVSYLGRIPYSEVQSHIKKAHICVFPSFAETFGMVTIESMALKKAVVNTSIGWAQELIDHGENGYLIHPTDVEAYANQILTLMSDKNVSIAIGKKARKKVEDCFDINTIAETNISYYKSLL